jgi:HlyD family secretion protein
LILAGLLVLAGVVFASIRAGGGAKGVKVYAEPAARRKIVQVVKASGELNPRVKVNISAHVIGKIDKLYVQEGDWIEKGRPFLDLEKQVFLADRDQWAAAVQSAETGVRQAQVALANEQRKLARAEHLRTEGIITQEQVEAAQLAEHSARLDLEGKREAVTQARANLIRAQTDLTKSTIYAPLSGRVITLNAKQGEVVVSGTMNNPASVIGIIADLSEVLAEVDVDETEIVHVKVGQSGNLKVDALPDKVYHGKVTEVGSSGYAKANQPDVTFFKVKLLLADADQQLRPGMSVRAEIATQTDPAAVVVPIQAVVERAPGKTGGGAGSRSDSAQPEEIKVVFLVAGGKARQQPVKTGISDETHVAIAAGLAPGPQVVTGPYRALRDLKDGEAVQVVKPSDEKKAAGKDDKSGDNS